MSHHSCGWFLIHELIWFIVFVFTLQLAVAGTLKQTDELFIDDDVEVSLVTLFLTHSSSNLELFRSCANKSLFTLCNFKVFKV